MLVFEQCPSIISKPQTMNLSELEESFAADVKGDEVLNMINV